MVRVMAGPALVDLILNILQFSWPGNSLDTAAVELYWMQLKEDKTNNSSPKRSIGALKGGMG